MKSLLKNKKLMLFGAIAWTTLIFIGCSLPGKDLPPISVFDHFDKLIHFIFFFVFALLWLAYFGLGFKGKNLILIILVCFGYGFAIEFYQINFVPGRSWDVYDGIADGVGGIAGVFFTRRFLF